MLLYNDAVDAEYLGRKLNHGVTVTVSEPLFDWVIENLLKNEVDAMGGEGTVLFHISERRGKVLLDISISTASASFSLYALFLSISIAMDNNSSFCPSASCLATQAELPYQILTLKTNDYEFS